MGGLESQRAIGTDIQYWNYYRLLLCKSRRNKLDVTIKRKGLGQRFEERRRGRPADIFNIIQTRPNTIIVHLEIDEAKESRRSYKEVRSR